MDDATRIRALKIYSRHTQENAIHFIEMLFQNSLSGSIPFGQTTVMSFRPSFIGMWRIWESAISYNRPRSPTLDGKMEHSHATDDVKFYQLLTYTGDVDLINKLSQREEYYDFHRPHGVLRGQTPYEVLREKLKSGISLSPEV